MPNLNGELSALLDKEFEILESGDSTNWQL